MTEAKLFRALYRLTFALPAPRRRPRERFCDRWIAMIYVWSALHDRPVIWACDARNWPGRLLDARPLPADSTVSRRLRTVGLPQLLERLMAAVTDRFGPAPLVKQQDSKPLLVGAYSKDRDARRGRLAAGIKARGYRLHALTHGRIVRHWQIGPMNAHDSVGAAPRLLARAEGGGYVLADNAYDTNALHAVAAAANHQLIAPPKVRDRHVRDGRRNNVHRLRSLDALASPLERAGQPGAFGRTLYRRRQAVESCFGELTMMGLHFLPAWARGPRRVALWAAAKILLHQCKRAILKGLMA